MREKFIRFMQGRNGLDRFSRFLIYFGLALMTVFLLFSFPIGYYLSALIIIYGYFRVFSRNYNKRYAENQWYLSVVGKIRYFFTKNRTSGNSSKTTRNNDPSHKIFKCPSCGQKVRVPSGRGKLQISCPKCKKSFIKRT